MRDGRTIRATAAALGGLAVLLGAFGAHGLEDRLSPEALEWYRTGALYHFFHAIALWCAADLASRGGGGRGPALCFLVGIVLFSGSLYALALTGVRSLGAITPFGGVSFLVGWTWLAVGALRARGDSAPRS